MKWLIIIALFPALCWAQEFQFQQEWDTIPVEINGWRPWAPFSGGVNESYAEFCDIDADGDSDMFIGHKFGYITYFQNQGDSIYPFYKEITPQYAGINLSFPMTPYGGRTSPVFCDIDNDSDYDLFTGDFSGLIHYWQNTGSSQNPLFQFVTDSLQNLEVSGYSKLAFWDIDHDGDYDLFIGDYYGRIAFYRNAGTPQQYNFSLVSNYWLNIDVGYNSSPCFSDMDADGDKDLFIGNRQGMIWFYRNIGDSLNYNLSYVTNYYNDIDVDWYATPKFANVDGDGDFDMYVGRDQQTSDVISPGDLFYYKNIGSTSNPQWQFITSNYLSIDEGAYSQNTSIEIDADGDVDLFTEKLDDHITFFRNIGNGDSAAFNWVTDTYQDLYVHGGSIYFSDIDADRDPDLFIGEVHIPNPPYPNLYLFHNNGTPQNANFSTSSNLPIGNNDVGVVPTLVDIDADGDQDLFLATDESYKFFQNIGTPQQYIFANPVNWQNISMPYAVPSCFYDLDHDGDLDLFMPDFDYNRVRFYRNIGTSQTPIMEFGTLTFSTGGTLTWLNGIDINDFDNDGDGDFLLATHNGGILFFRNVTGESPVHPDPKRPAPSYPRISILPNPGNSSLVARYSLPTAGPVSLKVYDIAGRLTGTLFYGFQLPGTYSYTWDAREKASGVYILQLDTPNQKATQKITILK
jgi:hypothetical protein